MDKKITILIPCLNEESTIGQVIEDSWKIMREIGIDGEGEVLVVDNGSTDQSCEIAKKRGARVVNCPDKGYGNALNFGIEQASGDYILMLDADGSYNPKFLRVLWDKLDTTNFIYDMVIGSRIRGSIEKGAMPLLHRYLGTPVLTAILNFFFKTKISDCNSGMRLFKKISIQKIGLSSHGMEFASEMLVKSGVLRLKISEVPIDYSQDKRQIRKTHLRTWNDGWGHLKLLLSYAPHYFFTYPGLGLFIIGNLIILSLYFGPLKVGGLFIDFHTTTLGVLFGLLGAGLIQMGLVLEKDAWISGYPVGRLYKTIHQRFTLEWGILLGIAIFGIGFLIDLNVFLKWVENNFSNIFEVREVLTATYLMYMGFQMLFFSFFLSFVGKNNHNNKL